MTERHAPSGATLPRVRLPHGDGAAPFHREIFARFVDRLADRLAHRLEPGRP